MPNSVALKTGNWTKEEVTAINVGYDPKNSVASVEQLAKDLNRTKRSVQGKLTREGKYIAPEKPKTVKKDEGPTKGELETAISEAGFDPDGFSATTKDGLKRLLAYVVNHNETVAANED